MSHLVSFHPIKLSYQFRSLMASWNSVYHSCCKVLNLLNFLQAGTGSTGIYNVTIVNFRYNCGVDNILKCFSSASSLHISWNTSSSKKRTPHKSDRKIKTKKTKVKNPDDGNLRHGADVNAEDVQHKTALHYAVQEHRLDTTKVNRARRERG